MELVGRRAMLRKLIRRVGPVLIFSEHMDAADGERMFRHACALGLEGIVSKRLDKPYSSGRCHHWRKDKTRATFAHDRSYGSGVAGLLKFDGVDARAQAPHSPA